MKISIWAWLSIIFSFMAGGLSVQHNIIERQVKIIDDQGAIIKHQAESIDEYHRMLVREDNL